MIVGVSTMSYTVTKLTWEDGTEEWVIARKNLDVPVIDGYFDTEEDAWQAVQEFVAAYHGV